MKSSFLLSIYFRSPLALGQQTYWTLDALAFGILDDMRQTLDPTIDPHALNPIARRHGVPLSSRAYFHGAVEETHIKIGGFRPVKDLQEGESIIRPLRGEKHAMLRTTNGPQKSHLTRYRLISAERVSWIASGEPEKMEGLIRSAGAVGALRKDGYGLVSDVEWEWCDEDPLTDQAGHVRRPVPVDQVPALGLANSISHKAIESWKAPYWAPNNRAICLVPNPA